MKNQVNTGLRSCKPLKGANSAVPRFEASSRHSLVLSSLPSRFSGDSETPERALVELVRYYRHSCVGHRCLGIVHQMSTPLQVLSLQLDLLEQRGQEELEVSNQTDFSKLETLKISRQEKYRQLRNELEKLQKFTQTLVLQGMHEDCQEKISLDLNQICRQELELYLADPFFKHQIFRDFLFGEGESSIFGHYIDFSQSFRNLIDNALEAMEGVEQRHLTVETICNAKKFIVRIGDTGIGIEPEFLPWIFEPFFTTKRTPGGVHAGLGLFMVRRLLAPYKAEIRVDSIPGETWVTISLPVA